jgi:Flp pilus assembly pilin Flp
MHRHPAPSRRRNQRGASLVEYAVILGGIALGAVVAMAATGTSLTDIFGRVAITLSGGGTSPPPPPPPGQPPVWQTPSAGGRFASLDLVDIPLLATDPDGSTVSYALVSSRLPPGIVFDATAPRIFGVSATAGSLFSATVRATDGQGQTADRRFTFSLGVAPPGPATCGVGTFEPTLEACVFDFTGSDVAFFVPAGADRVDVRLWGAGVPVVSVARPAAAVVMPAPS